jgi:hypothetical protein
LQVGLVNLPFGAVCAAAGPIGGLLCKRYSPRAIITSVGTGLWRSALWEFVLWGLLWPQSHHRGRA